MMDLRDELEQLAGRPTAPTAAQVNADLARGRGALRRRRTMRAAAGSLFAVAAAVAVVSVSGVLSPPSGSGHQAIDRPAAVSPAPSHTSAAPSMKLAAYKGKQPKGFTIDTVPKGWFVQGVSEYALVIAPKKMKNPQPDDFQNKIAIFLQSKDEGAPEGEAIKVGDRKGVLRRANGDAASSVYVAQPDGIYVIVQVWEGLGFTEKQVIELAAGVHVHGAKQTVG